MGIARALIADGFPDFREKLTRLLVEMGVEGVADVREASELRPALARTRPDLLILDMALLESISLGSYDAAGLWIRALRERFPAIPVVVLSVMGAGTNLSEFARQLGAYAYISKEDVLTQLPEVVKQIVEQLPAGSRARSG